MTVWVGLLLVFLFAVFLLTIALLPVSVDPVRTVTEQRATDQPLEKRPASTNEGPRLKRLQLAFKYAGSEAGRDLQEGDVRDRFLEGGRAILTDLQFGIESSRLGNPNSSALKQVADMLREDAGLSILIEGHTDHVGSLSHNQWLSERRAQSVRDCLVARHGIPEERLSVLGSGASFPIADKSPQGRQRNRRVEIKRIVSQS